MKRVNNFRQSEKRNAHTVLAHYVGGHAFPLAGGNFSVEKNLFSIRIVHKVGKKCKGGSVTIPHKHGL